VAGRLTPYFAASTSSCYLMNYLLLLLALLLATGPVSAQTPRRDTRSDSLSASLATTATAPDTVAALHRLFAAKRRTRDLLIAGLGLGLVTGVAISSSTPDTGHHGSTGYGSLSTGPMFSNTDVFLLLYAIPTVPLVVSDLFFFAPYRRKREQQAITDFQAHQLSRHLTRQLKARYFR